MALDSADNPQWQKKLQAGTVDYERNLKNQYNQSKRRNQRRSGATLQNQQADRQNLEQKKNEYSPEVRGGQEAGVKRELNKQRMQASQTMGAPLRAEMPTPSKTGDSGKTAGNASSEDSQRFGLGGIRGALAKQQNADRMANAAAQKAKTDLAGGLIGPDMAKETAKKASQAIWMAVHEFLEDAALSFIDLLIITGPICIFVFFFRLIAMLTIGGMLTVKFKGIEVPLVPMFTAGEILPRFTKMLLILLLTAIVWFVLILLIWAITDPWGFGWKVVTDIFGGGGGGAGAGASGTF